MEHVLAMVAVENVAYHFDILYGYLVPEEMVGSIVPGARVIVSFGRGKSSLRQGIVFELSTIESEKGYKKITSVVNDEEAVVHLMACCAAAGLHDEGAVVGVSSLRDPFLTVTSGEGDNVHASEGDVKGNAHGTLKLYLLLAKSLV